MEPRIIFPNDDGSLGLIIPFMGSGISIQETARKDTPAGKPYIILWDTALPDDIRFFDACEADFSKPTGVGIGHDAWFAEQARNK